MIADRDVVPLSLSRGRGTAGQLGEKRDAHRDSGGTTSLKASARKVLERDSKWDTKRDSPIDAVPALIEVHPSSGLFSSMATEALRDAIPAPAR